MRVEADTNGVTAAKFVAELLENGNIVDIDIHPQFFGFNDLIEINTVRRV